MLIELYIVLFLMALGSLIIGIIRKSFLPPILSVVLFSVLSFQSFDIEVVSGGTTISFLDPAFIYVNWLFIFLSFMTVLYGVAVYISGIRNRKNEQNWW